MERQSRWTTEDIRKRITNSNVVVFAKGEEGKEKCGFSKKVFEALRKNGRPFEVVDVSENPSISAALRCFSGHRELPVVYANGQIVSCADDLQKPVEGSIICQSVEKAAARKV